MKMTRITPACAGKSRRAAHLPGPHQDHPRLRGEKKNVASVMVSCLGSPPLARGKGVSVDGDTIGTGITHACAGKSLRRLHQTRRIWDHPRLRGEKLRRRL